MTILLAPLVLAAIVAASLAPLSLAARRGEKRALRRLALKWDQNPSAVEAELVTALLKVRRKQVAHAEAGLREGRVKKGGVNAYPTGHRPPPPRGQGVPVRRVTVVAG